jgi:predicted nucleic acid-binding protein
MIASFFLDTNILVYAVLQADHRSDTARALLRRRGIISVQVLNEFANVAHRKLGRAWPEVILALGAIRVLCPAPLPITVATHGAALLIAQQTGFQLYDAMIVASAMEADCPTLFSEDMQDGRVIHGRLTIRDPFKLGAALQ